MILDTLSNGLKDLFSTLGAKTTDSNYAVGLYNKTSGEPQGLMDMSSLASVLGGKGLGIGKVSGHDADINTRKGFLQGLIQTGGISQITTEPCDTIVFGNTQILAYYLSGTINLRVRVFRNNTWYEKTI